MVRKFMVMVAVASLSCAAFGQNLFQNPGFETGDFSGWTISATANGLSNPPETVAYYDIDGSGPLGSSLAAQFGVGQVSPQSGVFCGMEMTQYLSLIAGESYTFDFDLSVERISTQTNINGGTFDLIIDGSPIASWTAGQIGGSAGSNKYYHMNANYIPSASGNYMVGLRITRQYTSPGNISQFVDNCSLVPEPASLSLLLLGLLALRRR